MNEKMTRAFMIALDPSSGNIQINPPIFYQFQYNPNEKTDSKKVNWVITDIVGDHEPLINYGSGSAREIKFKLTLNTYTNSQGESISATRINIPGFSGVRGEIAKLQSFMYPNPQTMITWGGITKSWSTFTKPKTWFNNIGKRKVPQYLPPPPVLFGWGLSNMLKCVVKELQVKELLWNSYLDPIRAEADLTLVVDERSSWNVMDTMMRKTLSTIASLTNFNPTKSLPSNWQ